MSNESDAQIIEWKEPPPPRRPASVLAYDELAKALAGRPNQWAIIGVKVTAQATQMVKPLNTRALEFNLPGTFEVVARKDGPRRYVHYARFVPSAS